MDYNKFDNDNPDTSDAEYFAFVAWLSAKTAEELRQAKGNADAQKQALCRYYKRGACASLSTGELVDFLGVSSPSIIEDAGYDEEEGDALMQMSDALGRDAINGADVSDVNEPQTGA